MKLSRNRLFGILSFLILLAAIPLTIQVLQKPQEIRQRAAEQGSNASIIALERKIAGIDENGKLETEKAEWLAQVDPIGYQRLLQQRLIANPDEVDIVVKSDQSGVEAQSIPLPSGSPASCQTLIDLVQSTYGSKCGDSNYDKRADTNKDTFVAFSDYTTIWPHLNNANACQSYLDDPTDPCTFPTPTPTPTAIPLSPSITSCGHINANGNYSLTQDLTSQNECITIHDTHHVNLDCQNHTITSTYASGGVNTIYTSALRVDNVQHFSIKNCALQSGQSFPVRALFVINSSFGLIQNNNMTIGGIHARNSNNVEVANNTFNHSGYEHTGSSFMNVHDNIFDANPAIMSAGLVVFHNGNNNIFQNNTLNGQWNGDMANWGTQGADDGLIIQNETQDVISGNIINNNWDCGIETVGLIQDTQIINNQINNSGFCGIGGWYWNSWLRNTIDSNVIDGAPRMFALWRALGFDDLNNEQTIYFKDNIFSKNTFLNPNIDDVSSLIDFQNLPPVIPMSAIQTGNNIFFENDFGAIAGPILIPTSMINDQGNNRCLTVNDPDRPLICSTSAIPSPSQSSVILRLKFQGINTLRASKTLTVTIKQGNTVIKPATEVAVTSDASGVYSGTISDITPGSNYEVYVKGPTHLQKKFSNVTLTTGANTRDFTSSPLYVGDVVSSNTINGQDISYLYGRFGQTVNLDNKIADLNDDGVINGQDVSLINGNFGRIGD